MALSPTANCALVTIVSTVEMTHRGGKQVRIALMLNGVHESKIYSEFQLGVNKLASGE